MEEKLLLSRYVLAIANVHKLALLLQMGICGQYAALDNLSFKGARERLPK